MSKTYTRIVYTFDELSEEAQEKALEKYRNWNVDDTFWQECVIDDAKEIAKILGIEIKNIYFSGFSSQGDGACFEGYYEYAKQAVKKIKEYAPLDKELHNIAQALQDLQKPNFYGLSADVKHRGHYYHEYCTDIAVIKETDDSYYADADTHDALVEILRDFMRWIYKSLESAYEYETTDEAIKESLIANEIEFNDNGTIYH